MEIRIRFFGDLELLLDPASRGRDIQATFHGRRSVKDLIESYGVPHTEVAFITVDGTLVDFTRVLDEDEEVAVYPFSFQEAFAPSPPLNATRLEHVAFVCDVHLWKLARYLRFLGFDTTFDKRLDDPDLARVSREEKRVLLTRDRKLLMRNLVWNGQLIRSVDSLVQTEEVIRRFDLQSNILPFTRCGVCNFPLVPVRKGDLEYGAIERRIPEGIKNRHDHFSVCTGCSAVYWEGTHYKRLRATFKKILN